MDNNDKNNKDFENEEDIDIDGIDGISEKMPEIEKTQEMLDAAYFIPEKRRAVEEIFDWIEIFSSALITVILLFTFIFRLVTVQGPSMENTLHGGELAYGNSQKDNLIISRFGIQPKQGDIVVIQVPNPIYDTPIIKRVIATEGQTVDIDFENWIVTVDGQPLDEPYVNYEYMTDADGNQVLRPMAQEDIYLNELPITVEPGKIFVMGDNRNHSSDSRSSTIGQVDIRNVVGRVMLRVFPFNKFGVVKANEEY